MYSQATVGVGSHCLCGPDWSLLTHLPALWVMGWRKMSGQCKIGTGRDPSVIGQRASERWLVPWQVVERTGGKSSHKQGCLSPQWFTPAWLAVSEAASRPSVGTRLATTEENDKGAEFQSNVGNVGHQGHRRLEGKLRQISKNRTGEWRNADRMRPHGYRLTL